MKLDSLPPFPILFDLPAEAWKWPSPPVPWHHEAVPDVSAEQPCRIETPTGTEVDGFMLGMDLDKRTIAFRSSREGPALSLPFARFRRLTLTTPLIGRKQPGGHVLEPVPRASHERDYRVMRGEPDATIAGRTVGVVETEAGLFFFSPSGTDDMQLLRVFVPQGSFSRYELGPTAHDLAAERWVATPRELLAAIERQRHAPLLRIGESMVALGLVTRDQVDAVMAQASGDQPLGERLVRAGLVSSADLHTAIAHKMGYPLVDLARFPIDDSAARKLPMRVAVRHRSVPIMLDGPRIIVAMDRPSRAVQLQSTLALAPMAIVPVLASKGQILLALSALSEQNIWTERVSIRADFLSTST